MTRDDIIRMAREAGLWPSVTDTFPEEVQRFATSVYERAFIDGMQKQMQSSVDKAVNKMAQREWQGLTDEEMWDVCKNLKTVNLYPAIEAKLKEKNT
jgi:hypothetical protein